MSKMPPRTAPSAKTLKTRNKHGKQQNPKKNKGYGRIRKKQEKRRPRKPKELILQPKRVLKLKGSLKTPEDWARFDAWAEKNAQPKRLPEPEPIVRRSKPLYKLKRRMEKLARHSKRPDATAFCHEWIISEAALNHKASRRLMRLAWPIIRFPKPCREVAPPISEDVLKYEATVRIHQLSQPKEVKHPEECKPYIAQVSKGAMTHETTEREKTLALAKKFDECPQLLTEEEREKLFTPFGTRKTALTYKLKDWLYLLSLPPYKNLKDRNDETAENWKKQIIEELERRGKEAYSEQKGDQLEEKKAAQRKRPTSEGTTSGKSEISVSSEKKTPEPKDKGAGDSEDKQISEKEKKKEEKRKKRQNAWRYEPPPCKDHPFETSQNALKFEGSPRLETLAKAKDRSDKVTKRNPFGVRKGALAATASPTVIALAQPKMPREPVEKKEPYKKDVYGRPIIKKPRYGKKLPKAEPYKPRECPDDKDDKKDGEKKESKQQLNEKTDPIDPIAYQPSIDPVSFPRDAKIQKKERMKLRERQQKEKEKKK